MENNKEYIINSLRNSKSLRPETNAASAVLKLYARTADLSAFVFVAIQIDGEIFKFKHKSTGLFLDTNGSTTLILATGVTGRIQQQFNVEGTDANFKTRYQGDSGQYFTVSADADGTTVTLAPVNDSNLDNRFSLSEYSVSTLTPPVPGKILYGMDKVLLTNVQSGAEIAITMNGYTYPDKQTVGAGQNTILLNIPLGLVGDTFEFTQTVNGVTSAKSAVMKVNRGFAVYKIETKTDGVVTDIKYAAVDPQETDSTGNDPNTWAAEDWEGDETQRLPNSSLYNTQDEAVTAIKNAGFQVQTYSQS